ncbi:PREDICTED: uncharacterized protein LOC105152175 [Acromyrmex echinatior]|uniref:uncharacterized protein LOC105152175 n=1 Tax=Acromyrmex echinatior TaxID=103372 RepID=UPI0005810447|nr:PREDICTED: uncharacterized protein LOC105152175 [Acromyrmex echinatior]
MGGHVGPADSVRPTRARLLRSASERYPALRGSSRITVRRKPPATVPSFSSFTTSASSSPPALAADRVVATLYGTYDVRMPCRAVPYRAVAVQRRRAPPLASRDEPLLACNTCDRSQQSRLAFRFYSVATVAPRYEHRWKPTACFLIYKTRILFLKSTRIV